jgi:hypothetical protein
MNISAKRLKSRWKMPECRNIDVNIVWRSVALMRLAGANESSQKIAEPRTFGMTWDVSTVITNIVIIIAERNR